ncbi:hypothetical protein [Streptomyces jumonjinensis]|uniref:hypothetical protein n=1 Tax=Streptomyces jumonjinensis TaxID=1945 RepID=UPI0037B593A1
MVERGAAVFAAGRESASGDGEEPVAGYGGAEGEGVGQVVAEAGALRETGVKWA